MPLVRRADEERHEDKPSSPLQQLKDFLGAFHLFLTSEARLTPLTAETEYLMGSGNPGPVADLAF